jgi:hypothetical protein
VTAVVVEEPFVPVPEEQSGELPPLALTGDDETDETLALLRLTTQQIHEAQDRVAELSDERKRLVLALRRLDPPAICKDEIDLVLLQQTDRLWRFRNPFRHMGLDAVE